MADRDKRPYRKTTRSHSRSRSRSRSPRPKQIRRSRSRDKDDRRPRPDIARRLSAIANDGQGQNQRGTGNNRRPDGAGYNRDAPRQQNERQQDNQDTKLKIDREKTCPLLLRVFCKIGAHHRADEYARGKTPTNELQIYTWKDATLKELTSLVREVKPETRKKGTYFDFAIVFPDVRRGGYILKDVGTTCSGNKSQDDNIALYAKKFQIGDFIDVSITLPRERRDRI